jgi:hypothetical protein
VQHDDRRLQSHGVDQAERVSFVVLGDLPDARPLPRLRLCRLRAVAALVAYWLN